MNELPSELFEKIYIMLSNRISTKKKVHGKTMEQITDLNSIPLLSSAMHNKRLPSRNPYLLNNKLIYDLVNNLDFDSEYELIWGSDMELDEILRDIFFTGSFYLIDTESEYEQLINNCMYSYFPYAKYMAKKKSTIWVQKKSEYLNEKMKMQRLALEYIFFYIKDELKVSHKKFFFEKGIKKINNTLKEYVTTEIPKLLDNYSIDHKGVETFNAIKNVYKYESEEEFESIMVELSNESQYTHARKEIIEAGENYINTILKLQERFDPFYKQSV